MSHKVSSLLALLTGVLLAISQPIVIESISTTPVDSTGLSGLFALVAFVPLILAIRNTSVKRAYWLTFFAHLLYFMVTFYWIVIAMTVFGGVNFWISSAVLLIMSMTLANYFASAFAITRYIARRFQLPFWILMPVALCAIEYVRNYLFFGGFPWGSVGYAFAGVPMFLQAASLLGVYGLIFYAAFMNAALAENWIAFRKTKSWHVTSLVPASILTVIVLGFGLTRLYGEQPVPSSIVKVGVIQGNIEQGIKNKQAIYSDTILEKYNRLQRQALDAGAQLTVWPEAAYPLRVPLEVKRLRGDNADGIPSIIGAVTFEHRYQTEIDRYDLIHYNSALLLDRDRNILGHFHKSHLVPFGEYVPWPMRDVVSKIVPGMGAFGIGSAYKPSSLQVGTSELKVGATICYEGVFPEISRTFVKNGADLLFNVTNDAWYGISSAPYQHLNMYVLRAVETGRSYVRATNTGVSAWIDSYGKIHEATGLYTEAVVTADVPVTRFETIYLKVGDVLPQICLVAMLLLWAFALFGTDVFKRKRNAVEWLLGIFGFVTLTYSYFYFTAPELALDESAKTKCFVFSAIGFAVGCGALSGRPWGRRAIIAIGIAVALLGSVFAVFNGAHFLLFAVLGIVLAVLAYYKVNTSDLWRT